MIDYATEIDTDKHETDEQTKSVHRKSHCSGHETQLWTLRVNSLFLGAAEGDALPAEAVGGLLELEGVDLHLSDKYSRRVHS